MNIIDILKNKPGFVSLKPVDDNGIKNIENELNLKINEKYKDCIKNFGIFSFEGHEFCGITTSKRLNIIDVTNNIKNKLKNVDNDLYVIEELNFDDVVIWQRFDGKIYASNSQGEFKEVAKSFDEYIDNII